MAVLPLVLLGCSAAASGNDDSSEGAVGDAQGVQPSDFKNPLDQGFIRSTQTIADDAFAAKWTASKASGVLFYRSYPGAYHADAKQIAQAKLLGGEGLCFGDPHPDNFGFLEVDGKTIYAFNDLDDSGICPVVLDAARYVTAVRIFYGNDTVTKAVVSRYVGVLSGEAQPSQLPASLFPDIPGDHAHKLGKIAQGDALLLDAAHVALSDDVRASIQALFASEAVFQGKQLVDAIAVLNDDGGSGGLLRYWLLVDADGQRTVLELKQATTPGVDLGRASRHLSMAERLPILKSAFWNTTSAADYVYVSLNGSTFLVRDRLTKASLDLTKLSQDQLGAALETQASLLATLHGSNMQGVSKTMLTEWLLDTSKVLADRWNTAFSTTPATAN
jgi:hypothetical protein